MWKCCRRLGVVYMQKIINHKIDLWRQRLLDFYFLITLVQTLNIAPHDQHRWKAVVTLFAWGTLKAKTIKSQVVKRMHLLALFWPQKNQLILKEQSLPNFTQIVLKPFIDMLVNNLMVKLFLKYNLWRQPGGQSICLTLYQRYMYMQDIKNAKLRYCCSF